MVSSTLTPAQSRRPNRIQKLASHVFQTKYLKYLYARHVSGFQISEEPFFASLDSVEWFKRRLSTSQTYLEYGSGGSTVLAARLGIPFISIESDRHFLTSVHAKIVAGGTYNDGRQFYLHRSIGPTKGLGKPLTLGAPSNRRLALFKAYSDYPQKQLDGRVPDLVLVDGRFRVACALKALRALAGKRGWSLVVDDYIGRPHFRIIERYGKLDRFVGHMAVFNGILPHEASTLGEAIDRYERDYR